MTATVECYAGSTYPEHPRAFSWEGQRYEVKEIIDQHREPNGIYFFVLCEQDEKRFELFYNCSSMAWCVRPKYVTINVEKSDQNQHLKER